ncbi:MAG: DUF309 domain-containing protein [Acidobacteria bacterium]|nr:DUF309 domain-containing protein [Acidobacteriota bacterium]
MPPELHLSTEEKKQALFERGIELFNRRQFFDCHEVLEEIWTPARGPERLFFVGFYHHQRGNREGAERQLRKGLKKIANYLPHYGGVNTGRLRAQVVRRLETIGRGGRVRRFPRIYFLRTM